MELVYKNLKSSIKYLKVLLKWILVSSIIGIISGYFGSFFHISIDYVTKLRGDNPAILYLLPIGGLVIVYFYKSFCAKGPFDTNRVLRAASDSDDVPFILAPLIFVGTVLTHFFGGSAGREGAALQLGGTIGANVGKALRLKDTDRHTLVMSGMSAVFAALFGTPLTAAIFSIEVCRVGIMHYSALVPCTLAASVAAFISGKIGLSPVHFAIGKIAEFGYLDAGRLLILIIMASLVAILFCTVMKRCEHFFEKKMPSPYLRVLIGAALIILFTKIVGSYDYNGAGMSIVEAAIGGKAKPEAFILKIVFTAVTIAAGFKGGEIVPAFFIGSTFGCAFSEIIGFDPAFGAAIGFVVVFCSVVNCPLASIILALEVFGGENILVFALAAAISYMMSGYSGLYSSQRIEFSKLSEEKL